MFYIKQNFPLAEELWNNLNNSYKVSFLKEEYFIDVKDKKIKPLNHSFEIPSFFYPILLNYYRNLDFFINNAQPEELVSVDFRKDWGMFFRAVHSLKEEIILNKIKKLSQFDTIMEQFNGKRLDMAESSYLLEPLKGVFIAYLFWEEDEEFPASLKILFDKKLANVFIQDMVWGIIVETNYRIGNYKDYLSIFCQQA